MEFVSRGGLRQDGARPAFDEGGEVAEGKSATEDKQPELSGIGPDDGFDPADAGIDQGKQNKQEDGAEDGVAGAPPEEPVPEHKVDRDAGDINAHAGGQRLADEEQAGGGPAGGGPEGVGEELVRE